jgi:hypothetical protein
MNATNCLSSCVFASPPGKERNELELLTFLQPAFFLITKLLETLAEITNQLPYEQRLNEKTSTGVQISKKGQEKKLYTPQKRCWLYDCKLEVFESQHLASTEFFLSGCWPIIFWRFRRRNRCRKRPCFLRICYQALQLACHRTSLLV